VSDAVKVAGMERLPAVAEKGKPLVLVAVSDQVSRADKCPFTVNFRIVVSIKRHSVLNRLS
jgi:hypothetical protein